MQRLGTSAMFSGLSRAELENLLVKLDVRMETFEDGEVAVYAEDSSKVMGIVLSGHLHVYDAAFKGNRHLVRIVCPGEIVGASLITERSRTYRATVVSFGECRVATFSLALLRKLLRNGNDILLDNLAYVVCEELQASWRKIAILSCPKIEDRVLLYMRFRSQREKSKTFAIGSSEEQFAEFLGVHRTSLARVLRQLAKEGYFTYRRDVFTLL